MIKRGATIWDYIAWASLIGVSIWLILKLLGFINTPGWLEYSPLAGVVYIAGWAMHKLDRAGEDIKNINGNIKDINGDMKDLRNEIKPINENITKIKAECPIFDLK